MRGRSSPGVVRRWLRETRAATSLELALVSPFLLMIVLMVIENGLMLFGQALLDNATVLAARQVQIGTITTSSAFRSAICSYTSTFFTCANLQFYVANSTSSFPSPVTPLSTGAFSSQSFAPGSGSSYVVAEVAYNRTYVSPWLAGIDSSWILWSTTAFQNEPFS